MSLEALQAENTALRRRIEEMEQMLATQADDLSTTRAELVRSERTRDEFLANMSHELRTPLNAILGLAEALQEDTYGQINEKQRRALNIVESSGRHLLDLINDILDLSKIEAGKVELHLTRVSIEFICQSVLRLVKTQAAEKHITTTLTTDNLRPSIVIDQNRVRQILGNLLSNAVKFTPEGGEIGLDVVNDLEHEVVHFMVWDTGIGIASEVLERLFKPFSQIDGGLSRQYTGAGLGLALVARLTELHSGSVTVESQPEQGSRFTVSLPCTGLDSDEASEAPAPVRHISQPLSSHPTSEPCILLADDSEAVIQQIADALQKAGYRFVIARNGMEAIDQAKEQHPNLILMDLQMPRMDGLEAIRRIRADPIVGDTPIIALSSLIMPGDLERCLMAGANECLVKPVNLKALLDNIAVHIALSR